MSEAPLFGLTDSPDDRRLIGHVHPPAWRNPEPAWVYDLVIIGGGTAGLVSAHVGAALGARVALVERALLGGDCLVTGCVPSKALIRSARAAAEARGGGALGVRANEVEADSRGAFDRLRRLRSDIAENDSAARLAAAGVHVYFGPARFSGPAALDVGGTVLRFRRCVLATGARAMVPPVEGLREGGCLTNESVFSLAEAPGRLLVVGGGPVGCELGQAFARLGTRVLLVQRGERLLPRDDADASSVVARALGRDGVDVRLLTELVRVERAASGAKRAILRCGMGAEEPVEVDAILAATGRKANTDGMGLDLAGVRLTRGGFVETDDHLRTTNPRILAAGDVAGRWQFTHAADAMARVAVQNALFPIRRRVSGLVIPWCTFTDPEVAHVGLDAVAARAREDVVTVSAPMSSVDRAILDDATDGFARLHVRRRGGKILGATLVGAHAGESIAEIALAMRAGVSAATLEDTVHCYPTQAEALRRAAAAYRRGSLKAWMPPLLRQWYRLLR